MRKSVRGVVAANLQDPAHPHHAKLIAMLAGDSKIYSDVL